MFRLKMISNLLAVLASVLGVWGFYRMYQPEGLAEWGGALADYLPAAFAHPAVPIAAIAAVTAAVVARFLERAPRPAKPRKTHRLSVAEPSGPLRGNLDRDRRRLEGLLRGRGDMVVFVDELLAVAVTRRASDIHVQPSEGKSLLTLRIEGELLEVAEIAEAHHAPLVRRIKVMAELIPYKTDIPQDGRLTVTMSSPLDPPRGTASTAETSTAKVDLRISTLPTQHGERVVLRLVRPAAGLMRLDELGLDERLRAAFEEVLGEPQGLVVLTGPTGSGKTTTIYSALEHIHAARGSSVRIATIEDPVEIELAFLSQTQVDRSQGLDFATGLRAVLRQDPNVLMVGEIRDAETAEIAVQAGLSGHLVLTSLHAESTAGVFARLIDMRVEPFLVASATLACASQRLVRRLCPECRRPVKLRRDETARLARHGVAVEGLTFYRGEGCRACGRSGTRGRRAIYEFFKMTPDLRRLIASKVTTPEIERLALEAGMQPLVRSAVREAASGEIAVDEVLRIVG